VNLWASVSTGGSLVDSAIKDKPSIKAAPDEARIVELDQESE
jgi:hypothetical protein